ncbi:MAG TPA: FG-GAP-like repeat-containing protein [Tepidisphaeraceae bacterium]|nr:FG-GAP-like repeat-containing protein [Tepidisphaeraceae bacterium]
MTEIHRVEPLERRVHLSASFAPVQTFAVGTGELSEAEWVTVADLTGDGKQDLIADDEAGYVSVFLANGNGTFQPAQSFAAGEGPLHVTVGDFNGDDSPSVVVANDSDSGYVSVLLSNGNGTLQAPATFAAGANPITVAVADLTNNGKEDLIAANSGGDDLSILMGNGNGTFQPQQTIALGFEPYTLSAADLTGDGDQDLIVGGNGASDVTVLLSNGNGTFQQAQTYATGEFPTAIAAADLTGNGIPDLVVGNAESASISVLLGNGNGTFQAQQTFEVGGALSLAVGDVNGDGRPDIVYTNPGGFVGVLLGNGNGTFAPVQTTMVGTEAVGLTLADLTGDGKPDIITGNEHDPGYVSILLNQYGGPPTIVQTGGKVTATGTSFADTANVSMSGSNVIVTIDNVSQTLSAVAGIDLALGGGDDSINVAADVPPTTVQGAGGDDSIVVLNNGDSVRGGGGDDYLVADGSSETAVGGAGDDTIASGAQNSQLFGGPGDDVFLNTGGTGDSIDGGAGINFAAANSNDTATNIFETYDPDPLEALPGYTSDTVPDPNGGTDLQIFGTTGNDSITLSDDGEGNLVVVENGGAPQDFPEAGLTGVLLAGGLGDDTLVAESSVTLPVSLRGAAGNDSLVGGGGDNVMVGGAGNDTLQGGDGMNLLVPTRREVFVDGAGDTDVLIGGPAGSQNIADLSHRTDNLFISNDGVDHDGLTIMPNVLNIFAGAGMDTVAPTSPGTLITAGFGQDSLVSGGDNTIMVAGPSGAGEDTVVAAGIANSLFLMNGHTDEYEDFTTADFLQSDPGDQSI